MNKIERKRIKRAKRKQKKTHQRRDAHIWSYGTDDHVEYVKVQAGKKEDEGKKVELLGTYLESQAFKDALEKGVAQYVSTIEQPMLYLEVAFTAEATAAKALIDAWLKDNLAQLKKRKA